MPNYLQKVVPFHYRTNRRRRRVGLNPIQSYKQVTVDGPASRAASTNIIHTIMTGVDNYSGPTANNLEVPTGAKIFSVLVLMSFSQLVSVASILQFTFQCLRAGQVQVTPAVQGGDPNRNNVVHTMQKVLGKDQNHNYSVLIKIPRGCQRVREGDAFQLVYRADTVFASVTQAIYKFYR